MKELILASASPRRKEILSSLGFNYRVCPAQIEEKVPFGATPENTARILAVQKAKAVLSENRQCVVIGSDTVVAVDDIILGKPKTKDDAFNMLSMLSGKIHKVFTGLAVCSVDKTESLCVCTDVTFFELTRETIMSYIATNEPMDKAGAYGIQGLGSVLVKEIKGDYFSVMGLPASQCVRMLKNFGIEGEIKV